MDIKKAVKLYNEGKKHVYGIQSGVIVQYEKKHDNYSWNRLGYGVEFKTDYKQLTGYLIEGDVYFSFGVGKERDYYYSYIGNMLGNSTQDLLEEYIKVVMKDFLEKCTAFVNDELSKKTQLVEKSVSDLIALADSYGVILGDEYIKTSVVTKLMENISKMFSKYIIGEKKGVFSFFK